MCPGVRVDDGSTSLMLKYFADTRDTCELSSLAIVFFAIEGLKA